MAIIAKPKPIEGNLADFGYATSEFKIAVTGKSFKILIDGLYQDKPTSIVRELGTNAFDSHIMAGCPDRPFRVTLPSVLNPSFTVRDFGTSIGHEDVMTMYVTIFESTKEETNDQVGSWGLGSKSPFSYTDSFSVRAWKDGKQRDYIVGYNSSGIPTITHVNTKDSDEETGFEVSFAVGHKDFQAFRSAAAKVYRYFPTLPDCGDLELERTFVAPILSGKDWNLYRKGDGGYSDRVSVRQGCVVYPLSDTSGFNASSILNMSYGAHAIVDVPIGSVSVTASRETLSLDESTISFLRSKLRDVSIEMTTEATKKFNEAPTLVQALNIWKDLNGVVPRFSPTEYQREGMKKGIPVRNGQIEVKADDKSLPKLSNLGGKPMVHGANFLHVENLPHMVFIVDRGQKVIRKRLRLKSYLKEPRYYENSQGRRTAISKEFYWLIENPTNNHLKALIRRLELKPEQLVSITSLPDVETNTSPKTGASGKKNGLYEASRHLTKPEDDDSLADEFYWMPITKPTGPMPSYDRSLGWGYEVDTFYTYLWPLAKFLGLAERPVYYFTPNAQKRIAPDEKDRYDVAILAAVTQDKIDHVRKCRDASAKVGTLIFENLCDPADVALAKEWFAAPSRSNAFQHIFREVVGQEVDMKPIIKEKIELQKKYPMLFTPTQAEKEEYINMVNSQENK